MARAQRDGVVATAWAALVVGGGWGTIWVVRRRATSRPDFEVEAGAMHPLIYDWNTVDAPAAPPRR